MHIYSLPFQSKTSVQSGLQYKIEIYICIHILTFPSITYAISKDWVFVFQVAECRGFDLTAPFCQLLFPPPPYPIPWPQFLSLSSSPPHLPSLFIPSASLSHASSMHHSNDPWLCQSFSECTILLHLCSLQKQQAYPRETVKNC